MRPIKFKIVRIGLFLALIILSNKEMIFAETYYMPDNFPNLQSAFHGMNGGDTLIIRDGTYSGAVNVIDGSHYPPSGSNGRYTTIRAENSSCVVFDGEASNNMFYIANADGLFNYVTFRGIIWSNSSGSCVYLGHTDHIKFQECGGYDAAGENSVFVFHTVSYLLVEDTYIWGKMFYGINPYHCDHLVLRRVVIRIDNVRVLQHGWRLLHFMGVYMLRFRIVL